MVDRCIQFLTFISERNDRYMVLLEQLCREEFENEQTIRQALLSDMLRGVSENVYKNALQLYLEKQQVFTLDAYLSREDCDVPRESVVSGIFHLSPNAFVLFKVRID